MGTGDFKHQNKSPRWGHMTKIAVRIHMHEAHLTQKSLLNQAFCWWTQQIRVTNLNMSKIQVGNFSTTDRTVFRKKDQSENQSGRFYELAIEPLIGYGDEK